jgi:predicted amidohydrolase YtcJ
MHMLPGPGQAGVRRDAIGARSDHGWPWATILRSGGLVAFGSDWPIAPLDPLRHVRAAVEPRDPERDPGRGDAAERLPLEVALACATWGSAYAAQAEATRGALAVGRAADIVVLDRDVLADGSDALQGSSIVATIIDGRVVYRAG